MATYQLGPESPRPFSVISENYIRRRVDLPHVPEHERYSFGKGYEEKICQLIHQYLELGTQDRLCYVGDTKGSMAPLLQSKFCLLEPITTVMPGHIHYEESPNHRMLPIKVANVGAEEYFKKQASDETPTTFDKIMLKDAVPFFEDARGCYENMLKTLGELGKVLIVHRAAPISTLPVFTDAKDRQLEHDQSYMSIIQDLQSCGLDVKWDLECLPVLLPKLQWMSMIKEKFPPQLEMVSNFEITAGIRELSEGILKYEGEMVEFTDRLLFISAQRTVFSGYPSIQRSAPKAYDAVPAIQDLKYKMPVTPDITTYIKNKQSKKSNGKRNEFLE